MKKKLNAKKLVLHRETLRALDPQVLEDVGGAISCRTGGTGTSIPSECYCTDFC
jgi:hypothetical protein